jgi:hypothetical protein
MLVKVWHAHCCEYFALQLQLTLVQPLLEMKVCPCEKMTIKKARSVKLKQPCHCCQAQLKPTHLVMEAETSSFYMETEV